MTKFHYQVQTFWINCKQWWHPFGGQIFHIQVSDENISYHLNSHVERSASLLLIWELREFWNHISFVKLIATLLSKFTLHKVLLMVENCGENFQEILQTETFLDIPQVVRYLTLHDLPNSRRVLGHRIAVTHIYILFHVSLQEVYSLVFHEDDYKINI